MPVSMFLKENLIAGAAKAAPPVDRNKKEEPHDINEMPIPRGGFEAKMAFFCEMAFTGTDPTDG